MGGTVLLIRTVPFIFGAPLPFTAIGKRKEFVINS